ncbi:TIGR03085 family metal-binding protein [Kineosporia rhizophila]|uniref:TIGR03085 family metal-binding protein n=1 Tax=Kineosporia rhizophila TaxID=84633 RepID=UPI001E2BC10F|nr:TIGR03085 family metal-binding protein [Kineosporia rhizophila]MCE0540560.1 TIGR03085 family metal-binding protein [Kineosporia rhizophila]
MPSHSAAERQALADALTEAGPGAPTLCAGWTTTDLAVHLVVRENRPHLRVAGAIAPLREWSQRQEAAVAGRPYPDLVSTFRNGPARTSPFALPKVDGLANLLEHFVHCEDVRRAGEGWAPRKLPSDRQAAIWKNVTSPFVKALMRRSPVAVSLQVPGGEPVPVLRREGPGVVLRGEPGELALYIFGRKDQAQIEILGPEDAVARFREAPMRT